MCVGEEGQESWPAVHDLISQCTLHDISYCDESSLSACRRSFDASVID